MPSVIVHNDDHVTGINPVELALVGNITASDLGAIYRGADLLLDPLRFTVIPSRMKWKVVLTASEAMFQTVPTDLESFEYVTIRLRLYNEMDISPRTPDWERTVETFVGDDVLGGPEGVEVEVYRSTGFSESDRPLTDSGL